MDLLTVIRVVIRRWYVVAPLMLATVVAGIALDATIPGQYRTTGSLLITDPALNPDGPPDPERLIDEVIDEVADGDGLEQRLTDGTEISISPIGNATIEAAAVSDSATAAERNVDRLLSSLKDRMATIQQDEDRWGPDLRVQDMTPIVVAEPVADGRFQASGALMVIDTTEGTTNPYAAAGTTARLLEVGANSDASQLRLSESAGASVGVRVTSNPHDAAPILDVEIQADDPAAALAAFDAVHQMLDDDLAERQQRAQVPTSRQLTVQALAAPQRVIDESPPVNRLVVVVLGLGALAAIGLAVVVEAIARRRALARLETTLPSWPSPSSDRDEASRGNGDAGNGGSPRERELPVTTAEPG